MDGSRRARPLTGVWRSFADCAPTPPGPKANPAQPFYPTSPYGLTVWIEVEPPHPWHRLIYEAAAKARVNNDTHIEVVVAIEGVVHVLAVREIDMRTDRHGSIRMQVTAKPQGDPFPVPGYPADAKDPAHPEYKPKAVAPPAKMDLGLPPPLTFRQWMASFRGIKGEI